MSVLRGSIILMILIAIVVCIGWNAHLHPMICVEQTTVKEILELDYRDGVILLSNGETRRVNQATLKPGDSFCVKFVRK